MEAYEKVFRKVLLKASLVAGVVSVTVIAVGSNDARWSVATYFMAVATLSYLLARLQ